MGSISGRHILLVVGGGIAAYKSLDLVRRLKERGAKVSAVMTPAANHFITPLSLSGLTGENVHQELFALTQDGQMGHIELSRMADLIVVAPATADLMAKAANGLANDLASTLLLATDTRILFAPSMNVRMWLHPAMVRNLGQIIADGSLVVGPNEGDMACGEYGPGRMAEPLEIVAAIEAALKQPTKMPLSGSSASSAHGLAPLTGLLAGKKVVITSGPTHEPIDPVRYIGNRSSGRQGHAIAVAAAQAGAEVTLVHGPVALPDPPGVTSIGVETALEMLDQVTQAMPADIFIAAAAVADWRVAHDSETKIKKGMNGPPSLMLTENPDILATIGHYEINRPALVVGFAAETDHVLDHAAQKLTSKGCDMIIANDVSSQGNVFGSASNSVHILTHAGVESWPRMSKDAVAHRLIAKLASLVQEAR